MRFPEAFDGTFGQVHFGEAPCSGRAPTSAASSAWATRSWPTPRAPLPDKIPLTPTRLDAAYRLFKADEAAHPGALISDSRRPHPRHRMAGHQGVVLVAHGRRRPRLLRRPRRPRPRRRRRRLPLPRLPGFVTASREVLGLAHHILYCHPPQRHPAPGVPGRAGRLWRDAVEAIGRPPGRAATAGCTTSPTAPPTPRSCSTTPTSTAWSTSSAPSMTAGARPPRGGRRGGGEVARAGPHLARGAGRRGGEVLVASQKDRPGDAHGGGCGWTWPCGVRVWEPEPPAAVEAIDWLLLSNVVVADEAGAWEKVDWYACRVVVEEYHKAMKTGVSVEELQLTTRGRLEAAIAVLSVVAVVLLAVRDAGRREDGGQSRRRGWCRRRGWRPCRCGVT